MLAKQVQLNKVIGSILCVLGVILLLLSFSRAAYCLIIFIVIL